MKGDVRQKTVRDRLPGTQTVAHRGIARPRTCQPSCRGGHQKAAWCRNDVAPDHRKYDIGHVYTWSAVASEAKRTQRENNGRADPSRQGRCARTHRRCRLRPETCGPRRACARDTEPHAAVCADADPQREGDARKAAGIACSSGEPPLVRPARQLINSEDQLGGHAGSASLSKESGWMDGRTVSRKH